MKMPIVRWGLLLVVVVLAQHVVVTQWFSGGNVVTEASRLVSTLSLPRAATATSDGHALDDDAIIIPLTKMGGAWTVQVDINDLYDATLILDTGATHTTLSESLAFDAGLTPDARYQSVAIETANGTTQAWVTHLTSLRLGDATRSDLQIIVQDLSNLSDHHVDGLLGLNVLQHYRWRLDQRAGRLILLSKTSRA